MPAGTPVHYDDFGYWNFEDAIPVDMIDGMFDWYNDNRDQFQFSTTDTPFDKVHTVDNTNVFLSGDFIKWSKIVQEILENYIGHRLYPVYNMGRVYEKGIKMGAHIDRAPCQVSVTLPVAYMPMNWPIVIDTSKGVKTVHQHVGDMLLYKGDQVKHWRDENTLAQVQYQHYFHYIDLDTEQGEYMYQFNDQHLRNNEYWPLAYHLLKEGGRLPELTVENSRR